MGSCAAPSAKGDDKFITTDYLQQCPMNSVYFLTATSMENAERQLREVIHDRNIIYDLRECSFDELPAIFAQLPR
ncbi:TPA: hypothetical protein F6W23_21405 [Escherichia coli]|nr:hypothetical protein [Escherichia coli]